MHKRIVKVLNSLGRVSEHAGEDSTEGTKTDITNLRAAVRELQQAVCRACRRTRPPLARRRPRPIHNLAA